MPVLTFLFFVSDKCRHRLWLYFISHLPICLQDSHTPPWWVILDNSADCFRVTLISISGILDDFFSVTGKVVSGYRIRDGKWSLIGRQSPQLPQVCFHMRRPLCGMHAPWTIPPFFPKCHGASVARWLKVRPWHIVSLSLVWVQPGTLVICHTHLSPYFLSASSPTSP